MTDADDFEPYYWIGKLYVDAPGHTSWDYSTEVTDKIVEARDLLDHAPESLEVNMAYQILDDLLVDVKEGE